MATGNEMEARPPELIERAVRLLMPPPAREHVLGDLAERYVSPGQYLAEALRTLPFVISSQIRRTTNFMALPIVALVLMMGFSVPGGRDRGFASAAMATGVTLFGYMVRDAYRVVDLRHVWRQGLVDTVVAVAFLLVSQGLLAVVRPDWLLSPAGAVSGGVMLAVLYLLRAQNPGTPAARPWLASGAMSLEELRTEVRLYAQHSRRAMGIEIGAGVVVAPVFAAIAVFGHPSPARGGAVLAVLGIVFVVLFIRRNMRWQVPLDLGFAETRALYRARLERNHAWLRSVWWWYLLPLSAGPLVLVVGAATTAAKPVVQAAPTLGVMAVIWLVVALLTRQGARGLRRHIDALAVVEERR